MSLITQRRRDLPLDAIGAFCRRWNICFALFGSALRDDFVDPAIVWQTVTRDLPPTRALLDTVLAQERSAQQA